MMNVPSLLIGRKYLIQYKDHGASWRIEAILKAVERDDLILQHPKLGKVRINKGIIENIQASNPPQR